MSKYLTLLLIFVLSITSAMAYPDDVVFREDFSRVTGVRDLGVGGNSSERGPGFYLLPMSLPDWTLEGDPAQILGFDRFGDLAVCLNEGTANSSPQAIRRTIDGLRPGFEHMLSFEYWGDNRNAPYSFTYEINGAVFVVRATHAGQNSGRWRSESHPFTPMSSSTIIRFAETSMFDSSPIIDNIIVTVECPADFNRDGGVDGGDTVAFFAVWEAGDAAADVNADGGIDFVDVEAFFERWENGC